MSKGRVWNKGKRNGGGGIPPGKISYKERLKNESADSLIKTEESSAATNGEASRVNRVEKMNRDNWVTRPVRIKRDPNPDIDPKKI
ncbi:hypothetical protein [Cohnella silvisoli]|uniref:Uncharacterized protein n=1 Tax=Cohnella silvisoli TaxID=2873699 RepID=A0ABV1KT66_9BACL|nr:hypothetical protein [Cohnella silvisoli]MCD9021471.1 hypothetical protein [Cohnella silvisoli]